MKITNVSEPKVIMNNLYGKHNYFAWPTVAKLQNGKIAVVASGFRLRHVCPFGKMVISYSEDNGKTYSLPAPVIDTPLDDRDGGILPFGKSNVIVTSFNNTVNFQRHHGVIRPAKDENGNTPYTYEDAYLDQVTEEEEKNYIGATFRISNDYGITFGTLHRSPVTSPHGPLELPDGTLLWVGRTFSPENEQRIGIDRIEAHKIYADGTMEYVGAISNISFNGVTPLSCEPHAILLDDGRILAHIRVQTPGQLFTIYQSESSDNGKTWTEPVQLLNNFGGSPPHLLKHSSGMLICTYGFRGNPLGTKPFGVKVMFSKDNGKTWDVDHVIYENNESLDLGYPSTIELEDGTLLTVYYARPTEEEPAVIMQQTWTIEDK